MEDGVRGSTGEKQEYAGRIAGLAQLTESRRRSRGDGHRGRVEVDGGGGASPRGRKQKLIEGLSAS